jgi:hypothetical protein
MGLRSLFPRGRGSTVRGSQAKCWHERDQNYLLDEYRRVVLIMTTTIDQFSSVEDAMLTLVVVCRIVIASDWR